MSLTTIWLASGMPGRCPGLAPRQGGQVFNPEQGPSPIPDSVSPGPGEQGRVGLIYCSLEPNLAFSPEIVSLGGSSRGRWDGGAPGTL